MKKLGKTVVFDNKVAIIGSAGVVGKKEGEGPLANDFDEIFEDTTLGQESFELSESAMLAKAVTRAVKKAGISFDDVDFSLCGDLLDQCVGSAFAMKDFQMPVIGMYGACSTMALSLASASMLVEMGAKYCVAATSSHFASSERQFRFPLEYGGQRPPSAQWTVTGAGSAVVGNSEKGIMVKAVHIGTITDLGIKDANNMGAAMAPAAKRTICTFLNDTQTKPEDYDLILTGDLGFVGSELLYELCAKENKINIKPNHKDCGLMIYDLDGQDVNSGGSGCGCSASVLCSHIMKRLEKRELRNCLFVATGALMSPTSTKQGQTIPGIAHAVLLEAQN